MKEQISCDVAVVGAGLAGLAAADFLLCAGLDVRVFEASDRVGGRVFTNRLENGIHFEEGAFSFSDVETTLVSYIQRFGLSSIPSSVLDKRFKFGSIVGNFSDKGTFLVGPEKDIVLNDLLAYYLPNVPNDDTITFGDGLRKAGASELAISWLNSNTLVGLQGDGIESVSAFAMLQFMAQYAGATTFKTIRGGNDLLPTMIAQSIGSDRITLNTPIVQVLSQPNSTNGYVLVTDSGEEIVAKDVVLAIPLRALEQINFDPPLPVDKWNAITTVPYTSCSRMSLIAPPQIFGKVARGGVFATTDTPASWFRDQTLFQSNITAQTPTVFDTSFVGATARQMDTTHNHVRKEAVISGLQIFYPNVHSQGMHTEYKSWDSVPWIGGGYSYFPPNTIFMQSVLAESEGGLHFAGEHTSLKYASMNGAIESGLRAAKEILLADNKI